jgi:hypothetical protein
MASNPRTTVAQNLIKNKRILDSELNPEILFGLRRSPRVYSLTSSTSEKVVEGGKTMTRVA